jgi:hypothetical protein
VASVVWALYSAKNCSPRIDANSFHNLRLVQKWHEYRRFAAKNALRKGINALD